MSNALGIFGGRFDPVHYGHLHAAVDVRDALELAELRLVPARDPPHRGTPSASPTQRLAMLELALAEFPQLTIDARELSRIGKSYTIDTLEELRGEMPSRAIVLVMGVDTFAELPSWHRWTELLDFAHIAVVTRPGASLFDALRGPLTQLWQNHQTDDRVQLETSPAGSIFRVAVTPYAISATELRRSLARGEVGIEEVRGLLPAAVLSYIETHHLYTTGPDAS